MASSAALQYPLDPGGPDSYSSIGRFRQASLPYASSYSSNVTSLSNPYPPLPPYSPRSAADSDFQSSSWVKPSAVAAARSLSDHAKLHKRSSVSSSKGRPGRPRRQSLGRSSSAASTDTSSAQKPMAKERFKANLRKLTQQKSDDEQDIGLDLSKTAEENEKQSGLGIYSEETSSPTAAQINFASPGTDPGSHSRNISYGSQYSATQGAFKPSAPFAIPMRETPRSRTPPMATSYSTSMLGGIETPGEGLSNLSNEVTFGPSPTDEPSPPIAPFQKPRLRVNTTPSDSSSRFNYPSTFSATSPSTFASPSTMPPWPPTPSNFYSPRRRGTNQSSETSGPTSKSRTSGDRTFSFKGRRPSAAASNKDTDLSDALTRAASIQAARQAFEEKEAAKARKHEEREQKAAEKAQRKNENNKGLGRTLIPGIGGNYRRRTESQGRTSSLARHTPGATPTAPLAVAASGTAASYDDTTEYARMPAGPAPEKGEVAARPLPRPKPNKKGAARAGKGVKSRYMRFLSWLRTKLLNLGRGMRS